MQMKINILKANIDLKNYLFQFYISNCMANSEMTIF